MGGNGKAFLSIAFGAVLLFLVACVINLTQGPSILFRQRRALSDLLTEITLTDAHKNDFVNKHNELRRAVVPNATDMRLMTWDNELASLAYAYTRNCEFVHSSGLTTSLFSRVGENLRQVGSSSEAVDTIPNSSTQLWYDEVAYYDYNARTCQATKVCGHFKQVVYAESYRIGCGISVCQNLLGSNNNGFLISCNYGVHGGDVTVQEADGTLTNKRPYRTGVVCSQCGAGDTCVDRLCTNPARDVSSSSTETTASILTTGETTVSQISTTDSPTTDISNTTSNILTASTHILTATSYVSTVQNKVNSTTTSATLNSCDIAVCGGPIAASSCNNATGNYTCNCQPNYLFQQVNETSSCFYNSATGMVPSILNSILLILLCFLAPKVCF